MTSSGCWGCAAALGSSWGCLADRGSRVTSRLDSIMSRSGVYSPTEGGWWSDVWCKNPLSGLLGSKFDLLNDPVEILLTGTLIFGSEAPIEYLLGILLFWIASKVMPVDGFGHCKAKSAKWPWEINRTRSSATVLKGVRHATRTST